MKHLILLAQFLFGISFLNAQILYSEADYKKYFKENASKLDPIEGIWSISIKSYGIFIPSGHKTEVEELINDRKIAIIKRNNSFEVREFDSYEAPVVFFESTASNVYMYKNIELKCNTNAFLKNNGLLLEYERSNFNSRETIDKVLAETPAAKRGEAKWYLENTKMIGEYSLLKVFPTQSEYNDAAINSGNIRSTGTGFAISSNGYIVTNYHVIENAKQIKIRGVNGDFNRALTGTVITYDKNNDLAIIKINDGSFTTLGLIPYTIKQTTTEVGENVNVLGYPLTATMGEEIKFSNGMVSSRSGFQGDITSYQISAPIQPGNSGGPLFDKNGNIIGIINAKHVGAENVSYAVKSNYLLSLIETMPTTPKLPTVNTLYNKPLPQQIKAMKQFVYLLEIN